jgi:hypothetical protein
MVLDTGSDLSWLLRDPGGSRTFARVERLVAVQLPVCSAFGCMSFTYDSSPDGVATAGLLGMNRGMFSFVSQASTRRFSYCISDCDNVLLLGHSDLPFLRLNYQPTLPLPYFDRVAYSIQLLGIRVGDNASRCPYPSVGARARPHHRPADDGGFRHAVHLTPTLLHPESRVLETNQAPPPRAVDTLNFVFEQAFHTCFCVPAGRLAVVSLLFKGAEMSVAGDRLLYKVPGDRRAAWGRQRVVPVARGMEASHGMVRGAPFLSFFYWCGDRCR